MVTKNIQFGVDVYTKEILESLTLGALADLYNSVADSIMKNNVNRFSTKEAGVRRVWDILLEYKQIHNEKKKELLPSAINYLGMRAELPASADGDVVPLKSKTSIRAKCLEVLLEGATYNQLEDIFIEADSKRKTVGKDIQSRIYQMIRIFHYYYGYGTQSLENGTIIKLIAKKPRFVVR
jgi:hypothetical protein